MISRSRIRVRYAETDTMGVVYHSNFLIYFEVGRTDYFRELGFTYKELEEKNIFMPVTECFCRFIAPAKYDDQLEVVTHFSVISRLKYKFTYEVFRLTDEKLLVDGYTHHVPVNSSGNPCRVPQNYRDALIGSIER